jgi:putative DNA primase/helicase
MTEYRDAAEMAGAAPPAPVTVSESAPFSHDLSREIRMRLARLWLATQPIAVQGEEGDKHTYVICCGVANDHDLNPDDSFDVIRDWNTRCVPPWSEKDLRAKLQSALKSATGSRGSRLRLILSIGDPLPSARQFVGRKYVVDNVDSIIHRGGVFYTYQLAAGCYRDQDESSVRAQLYKFLEPALRWTDGTKTEPPELVPFQPTKTKVENVMDALRAVSNLSTAMMPPCWLSDAIVLKELAPLDMLACPTGLLHIPSRAIYKPTPRFFTLNAIDFSYNAKSALPVMWLAFLASLWPDDQESIDTLQEIFGYLLTADTRFHKIFMFVGPPRSGKGTIGRILTRLIGERNCCAPTLSALGGNFGKEPLIGKLLAIISDARISGKTDSAIVAEALLSISGGDSQTIARKYLSAWNGEMPTRFVIITNEIPQIGDVSGALASRFIISAMTESFLGREDLGLFEKLLPELTGILNWALDGRERLYKRGYFVQPKSADDMVQQLNDLGSPEKAFLDANFERVAGESVEQPVLFSLWTMWCIANGRLNKEGTHQSFAKNVHSIYPWLKVKRVGPRGNQVQHWVGLKKIDFAGEIPKSVLLPGIASESP